MAPPVSFLQSSLAEVILVVCAVSRSTHAFMPSSPLCLVSPIRPTDTPTSVVGTLESLPLRLSSPKEEKAEDKFGGDSMSSTKSHQGQAATNTINERLLAELQEAQDKERFGARSAAGKKMGLVDGFGRRRKSDEEIRAAIAEARDLNGVNPLVALTGGLFAFAAAALLWWSTNQLGTWFALHPPETDVYFVQRASQVFRNIVMGMVSLASGFFGVTGLGIFLLGVRVAYGVLTGELDPTPIKPSAAAAAAARGKKEAVDFGKMMDLMTNKKSGRRGGASDTKRDG